MSLAIYTAGKGMRLEMKRQQTVAQNIAAADLPGYKREYLVSSSLKENFRDRMSDSMGAALQGTSEGKILINHNPGTYRKTDRTLDFIVEGQGYFEVNTPQGGKLYTRCGEFHLNTNMELVTDDGYQVSSKSGGKIRLSIDDNVDCLEVTTDGYLRARDLAEGTTREIGQFKIVDFKDKDKLLRLTAKYFAVSPKDKGNMFEPTPFDPKDNEFPINWQTANGYLEMPNGSVIKDMVELIECNRNYEMNQKILRMLVERDNKDLSTFR